MSTTMFTSRRTGLTRGARRHLGLGIVWSLVAGCGDDAGAGPAPRPAPVASVIVTPDLHVMIVGLTAQLTASPRDAGGAELPGRPVSWSTSDESVAHVSASGAVTGVAEGRVRITAASEGKSGSVDMQLVFIPVASVAVLPLAATLSPGGTIQLTGIPLSNTGVPLPGRVVTWSSSDPSTATVSASGLVTAAGVGSVSITATSEGRTAIAQITVVPAAGVYVAGASRRP